jgi:hypothetical protein
MQINSYGDRSNKVNNSWGTQSMARTDSEKINTNAEGEQSSVDDGGVSGRVKSAASPVKQRASTIPAMLADGLEAGAEALRQRRPSPNPTTPGTSVAVASDSNIDAVTDTLATGMQSSAEWLRDADLDKLKSGVEKQVKEHPARSLLVALGAGFLIGKILRR